MRAREIMESPADDAVDGFLEAIEDMRDNGWTANFIDNRKACVVSRDGFTAILHMKMQRGKPILEAKTQDVETYEFIIGAGVGDVMARVISKVMLMDGIHRAIMASGRFHPLSLGKMEYAGRGEEEFWVRSFDNAGTPLPPWHVRIVTFDEGRDEVIVGSVEEAMGVIKRMFG